MTWAPTPAELRQEHQAVLESMTEDDRLVMSREILAAMIRLMARQRGITVSRSEALDEAFRAEANARAAGATPKLDFFVPLENELPLEAIVDQA